MKPRYSFVKKMAQKVLMDFDINTVPVDMKAIFTSLGIKYVEINDSEGIDGAVLEVKDRGRVAVLNVAKSLARQRFTLAHEFGHFFLQHSEVDFYDPEEARDPGSGYSEHAKPPQEIEADVFASELLIPRNKLAVLFKENGDLEVLANKFLVSKDAMDVAINQSWAKLNK